MCETERLVGDRIRCNRLNRFSESGAHVRRLCEKAKINCRECKLQQRVDTRVRHPECRQNVRHSETRVRCDSLCGAAVCVCVCVCVCVVYSPPATSFNVNVEFLSFPDNAENSSIHDCTIKVTFVSRACSRFDRTLHADGAHQQRFKAYCKNFCRRPITYVQF